MRLIGDVHQKINQYIKLIENVPSSIQLGDMGFDYSLLKSVDPKKHKFLPGNHDNYQTTEYIPGTPHVLVSENEIYSFSNMPEHCLGNYGVYKYNQIELFFVRGAHSIDWRFRTIGIDLFEYEELSNHEMKLALELYKEIQPKFVISHEAPLDATKDIHHQIIKNRTAYLLQEMLENHQPELWVFGHHHVSINKKINGTQFVCLNELEFLDL